MNTDDRPEIEHWGGVIATSELIAKAAQLMTDFAKSDNTRGVLHEATIVLAETAAILRFLDREISRPAQT